LADASELGWRVVAEYESNPIASDSDDERRIYKAEMRASRKAKADKTRKRSSRSAPYPLSRPRGSDVPATATFSQASTGQRQRPGTCFLCGKPGHWKSECLQRDRASNNKISSFTVVLGQSEGPVSGKCSKVADRNEQAAIEVGILKKGENVTSTDKTTVSPVGRLRNAADKWKCITDSSYMLDVVENGYRLPFKETPEEVFLKNNKSARENPEFVRKEIQALLDKGVVSEVKDKPKVVNPLTVAYNKAGKPRLVLDCRHVNPNLHLFKVKFEDIRVAQEMFELSSYVFTFDLKSAYHHIDIFPDHRMFLGFAWEQDNKTKYYIFNSLPFGIATAGHIFTKTLRCVVKHCRTNGHRVIMFLDDGIGGQAMYDRAVRSSKFVRDNLLELGFLLANDKCNWMPVRISTWLGHVLNFEQNKLFIAEARIIRLRAAIDSLLLQLQKDGSDLVPVRYLASVTGQIISLQSVLGKVVCRMTRHLHKCIDSRNGWNCLVEVSDSAKAELKFWKENVQALNELGKSMKYTFNVDRGVFSDASATGYGGYVVSVTPYTAVDVKVTGVSSSITQVVGVCELSETSQVSNISKASCMFEHTEVDPSPGIPEVILASDSIEVSYAVKLPEASLQSELLEVSSLSKLPEVSFVSELLEVSFESKLPEASCLYDLPEVNRTSLVHSSERHITATEGAFKVSIPESEICGSWSETEATKSSTWRDLETMVRVVRSNLDMLENKSIKLCTDNKKLVYSRFR